MKEMIKMVVVLTILCLASGSLLAKLNEVTKEPIAQQVLELVTAPVLRSMFEDASNNPIEDRFTITDGDQERDVFVAVYDGKPSTIAFEAIGKGGFGGDVGLMVAIDVNEEKLMAASVTTHAETPGLGANAKDDPTFTAQFAGLGLDKPIQVTSDGGEINAMSGATVTSRAVCRAATEAQNIYKNLKPQISEKLKTMQ
jgi:electron transport complex protein RnfG